MHIIIDKNGERLLSRWQRDYLRLVVTSAAIIPHVLLRLSALARLGTFARLLVFLVLRLREEKPTNAAITRITIRLRVRILNYAAPGVSSMYIRDVRTNSAAFHPEECYVDVSFGVVQSSKKCQRLVSPNVACNVQRRSQEDSPI